MTAGERSAGRPRRRAILVVVALSLWLVPVLAAATVEEQRRRLPPAADCDDPVTGVWKSHKHDPRYGDWYMFTLTVERSPEDPNRLAGTIHAHSWTGGPQQEEPPPCGPGVWHWTVMMNAAGSVSPTGEIRFGGIDWRPENAYCGRMLGPGEYNPDHFSGTIDPAIQEFQSVNNDGGRSVNDPMVFRRVSCGDQASPPNPDVNPVPPAFQPDLGGCGCDPF